jgi:hypothetical protein
MILLEINPLVVTVESELNGVRWDVPIEYEDFVQRLAKELALHRDAVDVAMESVLREYLREWVLGGEKADPRNSLVKPTSGY